MKTMMALMGLALALSAGAAEHLLIKRTINGLEGQLPVITTRIDADGAVQFDFPPMHRMAGRWHSGLSVDEVDALLAPVREYSDLGKNSHDLYSTVKQARDMQRSLDGQLYYTSDPDWLELIYTNDNGQVWSLQFNNERELERLQDALGEWQALVQLNQSVNALRRDFTRQQLQRQGVMK